MKKIIVLFFVLVVLSGCAKVNEYDAKTLADIGTIGFNGKGKVTVSRNESDVQNIIKEIEKKNGTNKALRIAMVLQQLDFEVVSSKQESLSNGDSVKIKATYPETDAKNEKIKFTNTEFTYAVSDLRDAIVIDLFADIELEYKGISPNAEVTVSNHSKDLFVRNLDYHCSPYNELRIGDKVVVTVEANREEAEREGYILPDVLTKEYTVDGIDEYLLDFNDLDAATKEKMKKLGSDLLESSLDGVFSAPRHDLGMIDYPITINTPELYKIYFNTIKQSIRGDLSNDIFYVYKITAIVPGKSEPKIGYMAVLFPDAIKRKDGSVSLDISKGDIYYSCISKDWDKAYESVAASKASTYDIHEITP